MRRIIVFAALGFAGAILAAAQGREDGGSSHLPARAVEITAGRTRRAQTFDTGGGRRMTVISAQPRFTRDRVKGGYRSPDLTARAENSGGFTHAVTTDEYRYRFTPGDQAKGHSVARNDYSVTYTPTGDWAGKTSVVTPLVDGVKEDVHFAQGATTAVSWLVETDAQVAFDGSGLEFRDTAQEVLFHVPPATAFDANGLAVPVEATFDGHILTYTLEPPAGAVWPIVLDPSTILGVVADEAVYWYNTGNVSYLTGRASETAGNTGSNNIEFGQYVIGGTMFYSQRVTLVFDTSGMPDDAVVDSAKVVACLQVDNTQAGDFGINLLEGTYSGTKDPSWYNDFVGWASGSSAYSVTPLAPIINTITISVGDTLRFPLNETGLGIVDTTDKTRFMLLSSKDISATQPSGNEYIKFEYNTLYFLVWYHLPQTPKDLVMSPPDTSSILCTWTDRSNEDLFYIIDMADSSVVGSAPADAVADTITGLSPNTRYIWAVVADSAGVQYWSEPDTCYTHISAPGYSDFTIMPLSSDTLRVTLTAPPNATQGDTGMEVDALAGTGATDSGWITGVYSYRDGGLDPTETYTYRARYKNGDGVASDWSPPVSYQMEGSTSHTVATTGDASDDFNLNGSAGYRDSTVVRTGKTDAGAQLDGFFSFNIPWQIHKGGVDSLFLRLTRTAENAADTPTLNIYAISVKDLDPVETLDLGAQSATSVSISWTIVGGAGEKRSPDLRPLFRLWQDLGLSRDYSYGFGLRLDDAATATGVRAVFQDASDPAWDGGTALEVYYTPGVPDSMDAGPTDFSLEVAGPDSIVASWTDTSRNELGFVLCNLADSTQVAGADTLAEDVESTGVGGLTPNTVHAWFVRAFSAADDSSSSAASARTDARAPGATIAAAVSGHTVSFIIDPRDNPAYTRFAVQDSLCGLYVDGVAIPDTLRSGPPGDWGWRTFLEWGGAAGDTLTALAPDSLVVIRAKARTGE